MFLGSSTRQAIFLFFAVSLLYFLTCTPALDEWDSVQFAMGVGDFNLWKHQPHPPGYPLYIAFGWMGLHLLRLDVQTALQLGSALGGGLFVACWYVLWSRRFSQETAWLATLTLLSLPVVWMDSTKVLTDPLGAGLFALTLLFLDNVSRSPRVTYLLIFGCAAAGAAAVGVRPQNFGVVLLLYLFAWGRDRQRTRFWLATLCIFLVACLLWLIPVLYLQSRTPESLGSWTVYGEQLLRQWQWRIAKPKVFLGAAGQTGALLLDRLNLHFAGWFRYGFGFMPETAAGWLGIGLLAVGWTLYGLERFRVGTSPHKPFWQSHLPWAIAYVAMIFCCLPPDQRYYLPIFPLLILPAVAGWHSLPSHWRWMAALIPVACLIVTLPLVGENHTQLPPPLRLIHFLQNRISANKRPETLLVLRDSRRHAEWYAPNFRIFRAEEVNSDTLTQIEASATGEIYTDDPAITAFPPPNGRRWRLLETFHRSPLIYRKHNTASLYRLE